MNRPTIRCHPTEIFGYSVSCDNSDEMQKNFRQQYCPFLKAECKKFRKSTPEVKIGSCSLGYKGEHMDSFQPVIVCPERFNVPIVFDTIKNKYLNHWPNIAWRSEVSMGVGGSVDWVAVNEGDSRPWKIDDFLCVEFQAAGTTGTPWDAIEEFKRHHRFTQERYGYGINWANEFSKTMMQQVFKKGNIVEHWKRKIVFVVQDVGMDYIKFANDWSGFREPREEDPIHFLVFTLLWEEDKWQLRPTERLSTDLSGVAKVLAGANMSEYPSVEDFIRNIERKR